MISFAKVGWCTWGCKQVKHIILTITRGKRSTSEITHSIRGPSLIMGIEISCNYRISFQIVKIISEFCFLYAFTWIV